MTAPRLLYVTADAIGTPTGGGKVTCHESRALNTLSDDTEIWQFPSSPRPWGADLEASARLERHPAYRPTVAHFYSGTFTRTIEILKSRGTVVTYTAAAHDIAVSKEEHERMGIPFDYPHLTDPDLWAQYVRGYLLADFVICPSDYSMKIMRSYGQQNVVVIPHGFDPPARIAPMPARFVVGYLGQAGPDKGLLYLLRAWDAWNQRTPRKDALLMIAGRGTLGLLPWVREHFRHGSYEVRGEVKEPSDLYDACCLVVQPSASEGFACEVLEARAHGRPVVCSDGAGASTFATQVVAARDDDDIEAALTHWHDVWSATPGELAVRAEPDHIKQLAWSCIRERYRAFFEARASDSEKHARFRAWAHVPAKGDR